ncbi:MAG: TIGR01212 family radical SAM protein [Candidatus Accumulibacter sp.]|jgi:radical SAM protein (TIGR01212 family)|nr:TIGR01212 family radical SAM protein [Accumulibacter sp.]
MTKSTLPTDDFNGRRYNAYNDWVRRVHGGRLQKVSVDAGFTCPNRDGTLGVGGCAFCNNAGFTPGYLREQHDILDQITTGVAFMRRRYHGVKAFLAYFQSYTNTYGKIEQLRKCYETALGHPDITGLVIGTRPDCLPDDVLDYLADLARWVPLELEIGIESCNDAVLRECRRGHDFVCTQNAVRRATERGLSVTGHLLLGLPLETRASLIEGARALAQLSFDALKFHQLQIIRGTRLAWRYLANPADVPLMSPETYLDAVIDILEYLPGHIKIQRLGSEIPAKQRVSPDWGGRFSRFLPIMLDARLTERKTWQGRLRRGAVSQSG